MAGLPEQESSDLRSGSRQQQAAQEQVSTLQLKRLQRVPMAKQVVEKPDLQYRVSAVHTMVVWTALPIADRAVVAIFLVVSSLQVLLLAALRLMCQPDVMAASKVVLAAVRQ